MILSIGEILADMVGEKTEKGLTFNAFIGGAPFNVAVNAKQYDAKVKPIDTTGAGDYFYLPFVAAGKFTVSTDKTAEIIECLPSKQD